MITMYFGSPGCGKSTLLAKLAILARKSGYDNVVTNAEDCDVAAHIDIDDLATKTLPVNTLLLVDEAGIVYNNRKFKTFSAGVIEWYKMHRHEGCDVVLFSQSWEDVDITIRRLTNELYHLKKVGPFTLIKKVYKRVDVDDKTHQIIDAYKFGKIFGNLIGSGNYGYIFRPLYYKYFDSFCKLDREVIDVDHSTVKLGKWDELRTLILSRVGHYAPYAILFGVVVWIISLFA